MNKHSKHTHLERREYDRYAPNEIAILGTNCTQIAALVSHIAAKLPQYKLAYFDASHSKEEVQNSFSEYTFHHHGNLVISTSGTLNPYALKLQFAQYDLVFINGNHYQGATQILILDEAKEASVLKRIHQLDRIQFVVKLNEDTPFFSSVKEKIPHIEHLTSYSLAHINAISSHIERIIKEKIAPVKGLVLVGGKSTRMGMDKSMLVYYDSPQKDHVKSLLEKLNIETYFSVEKASDKKEEIADVFVNLGPFGGICSAFQKNPNSAWIVLATDLPFVTHELIELLLSKRNPSKVATAIKGNSKEFVEPLITIYEPKAYPILLQYLSQGYSCPRKMLINSDIEIVEVADALIQNINTKEAFEIAKKELANNHKK